MTDTETPTTPSDDQVLRDFCALASMLAQRQLDLAKQESPEMHSTALYWLRQPGHRLELRVRLAPKAADIVTEACIVDAGGERLLSLFEIRSRMQPPPTDAPLLQ